MMKNLLELVEMDDYMNSLPSMAFQDDDTPVIKGSALKALEDPASANGAIRSWNLMDTVDELHSQIHSETQISRSLMPVEDVFTITGRGTVATGRVEGWCSSRILMKLKSLVLKKKHSKSCCHRYRNVP